MKRLLRRLPVKLRKWRRTLDSAFTARQPQSNIQDLAVAIVRRAICYDDANLLTAPISGTKYIHYDDIFIKVEGQLLTIINGTYTYDVTISMAQADRIYSLFNRRLEITRKNWEQSIRTKTERSLATIYNELINK